MAIYMNYEGIKGDTTLMNARKTFEIATMGGARSLHQGNVIGSLEVGKSADIVLLDLSGAHAIPFYDCYNHLTYAARAGDVRDVFVDGRLVVEKRKVLSIDMQKLRSKVDSAVAEMLGSAK